MILKDGCSTKVLVIFVILCPLLRHCKYYTAPFNSCQWMSTWLLRTGHIRSSAMLSKTKNRILYELPPRIKTSCILHMISGCPQIKPFNVIRIEGTSSGDPKCHLAPTALTVWNPANEDWSCSAELSDPQEGWC